MDNILEVRNLTKKLQDFMINDVNFNLGKGQVMGFIGPNGAGKSTTIRLIMNLIKKDSGEINIFGLDNVNNEKEIKEKIGFVYDETYCYEDLNLIDMKNIIARFYKHWDDEAFYKYILEFNLPEHKKIKELSKGMKIKYSLAIALSHKAELIIMDEPTSGLDPVFRRELLDIIGSITKDKNKSVFFSTHITTDLEKIADLITFINDGKMVFSNTKEYILKKYKIVKGDNQLINSSLKKELIGVNEDSLSFEALTDNIEKIKSTFGKDIFIENASLEDIMFYIVRGYKNV